MLAVEKKYPRVETILAYKEAAIADGWAIDATDTNRLTKSNCSMYVVAFDDGEFEIAVANIWGADGLAIARTSDVYSWEDIVAGHYTCGVCNKTGVKTYKIGVAGRVCE